MAVEAWLPDFWWYTIGVRNAKSAQTGVAETKTRRTFMKNEAFIEEVKVGFGVFLMGFFRTLFKRIVRGLVILEKKLADAIKKWLPLRSAA